MIARFSLLIYGLVAERALGFRSVYFSRARRVAGHVGQGERSLGIFEFDFDFGTGLQEPVQFAVQLAYGCSSLGDFRST